VDPSTYTGVDNLEVMEVAVNYGEYLVDLVARSVGAPPPEPIIDFGTGAATHAIALRERGYQVACVESDASLRAHICDIGFRACASTDELDGEHFPAAYTLNVLEHIDDDVGALRSLHRLIAPSGTLVVYVPAFQALYTAMDRKVGHVRRYRRRELMEKVTAAGFDVQWCSYADSLGFLATLAYRAGGNRDCDLNPRAVAAYDRYAFPISRAIDHVAGRLFGKNLALVARRPVGSGRAFGLACRRPT
jgi:SAM-dependent methyltransferase